MTSQRLVEQFARYLWERDEGPMRTLERRVPDSYMNEAAVFLAGELGQRLQRGERITGVEQLEALPIQTIIVAPIEGRLWQRRKGSWRSMGSYSHDANDLITNYGPLEVAWIPGAS